jgi:exonuclease SbcD
MLQFQPPLLKTDLKLPSQKTVLEIQLPQYEFPIRIITTPYANESRLKRYLGAENKEEQLNQLLQDSWAALADKYCDTKGSIS